MADDQQDRNLPASARKLQKAREDGQVARSRDLGHFATIGGGVVGLAVAAPWLSAWSRQMVELELSFSAKDLASPALMVERLAGATLKFLVAVVPLGLAMMAVALLVGVACGGWNWTLKPLSPKFSKINPLSGLGRMFSSHQLIDTLKSCLMVLVIGTVGGSFLYARLDAFPAALSVPLPQAIGDISQVVLQGLALMLLCLAVFAAIDVPLQRFQLAKRLRMSVQEAKQEYKELEGNQEVKSKMKVRMREMARRRMLAEVPRADLVVMNPTHYAVALKYEEGTMSAPRVVAKGADLLAMKIRDIARDAKVPVLQAPMLARALYAHAEIDREIPQALFSAVAQVLAYVYQLRAALSGKVPMPGELPELNVPVELDPHHGKTVADDGREGDDA
jgi:flagellar biosynthetic protein FlhB